MVTLQTLIEVADATEAASEKIGQYASAMANGLRHAEFHLHCISEVERMARQLVAQCEKARRLLKEEQDAELNRMKERD